MGMASIERAVDSFGRLCGGSRTVLGLVIANCAIFILILLAEIWIKVAGGNPDSAATLLALPSPAGAALRQPWTLLTYMVTQVSFLHLLFNMLWFICFGGLLRERLSEKALFWLYVGAGIAGGLFFELGAAIDASAGILVGSSASVLGIMAAAAIMMPTRRIRLFLLGDVQLKWIAIGMILLTFAGGSWRSSVSGAFWAHIGGTLYGVAAALTLRYGLLRRLSSDARKVSRPKPPRPQGARRVAKAMNGRLSDPARLDQLLDKIRVSGYASLSDMEQRELEEISRRLNR